MLLSPTTSFMPARDVRDAATGLDAGLRDYMRAFAAPLVPLAVVSGVLALAMWFAQLD